MGRREWDRAGVLAGQAGATLRQAGLEEHSATSLVCAARAALHDGDVRAARQQPVRAQRLRPLLTYAVPHLAVQARIDLTRAHLALSDLAGARTLLREISMSCSGGGQTSAP
jgi:LuxR family transcriptional regulator, maltose regulon positive regulatory protein